VAESEAIGDETVLVEPDEQCWAAPVAAVVSAAPALQKKRWLLLRLLGGVVKLAVLGGVAAAGALAVQKCQEVASAREKTAEPEQ
jgi:hypothetical protein